MSKGLEALESLRNDISNRALLFSDEKLDTVEKELKALEIIKERRCNVADFIVDNPNWQDLIDYDYWFSEMPTVEEFDLLKEILTNEH